MKFQKDTKEWIDRRVASYSHFHISKMGTTLNWQSTIRNSRFKIVVLFFVSIFCLNFSQAQIRKELENKRQQLLKEIDLTSNLLNKTTRSKAAALDRYVTLRKQMQQRELLVETLRKEIDLTEKSIQRTKNVVEALTNDIAQLEKEYGQLLREAYRRKKNNSTLSFVFSAETLNQGFQRWQYLRQYDEYRKKQALLIVETKEVLLDKKEILELNKSQKEALIAVAEKQKAILSAELGDKTKLLHSLRKDEKRLKKELRQYQTAHQRLKKAIEKAIQSNIATRKKDNKKSKKLNKKPKEDASVLARLTQNFKTNRGRLPMPVKNGIVTKHFGKRQHPTLPKVQINNNGIDIRTKQNEEVFAIFEGKVVSKQFIPGYQNMLIVQHGDYYTVYSNLSKVSVKKGDHVSTLQKLGTVAMNKKTKVSEVHFEVWRAKVRLNPEDWVE
ncbi:MAG TPA: hypothetical protein ENJ53_07625 [Phaeodactylibacter sp.]|nr:hypothetical protein [Phaeodactylibacter sp.]